MKLWQWVLVKRRPREVWGRPMEMSSEPLICYCPKHPILPNEKICTSSGYLLLENEICSINLRDDSILFYHWIRTGVMMLLSTHINICGTGRFHVERRSITRGRRVQLLNDVSETNRWRSHRHTTTLTSNLQHLDSFSSIPWCNVTQKIIMIDD